MAAFRQHPLINKIIVIADHDTTDDTLLNARDAGADVSLYSVLSGKGELITYGLRFVTTERVIFSDADYTGLGQEDIAWLISVEIGPNEMRICIPLVEGEIPPDFDRNRFLEHYPHLSGLRSVEWRSVRNTQFHGYLVETELNRMGMMNDWPLLYKYSSTVKAPLRFTPRRMEEMERDRVLGRKLGLLPLCLIRICRPVLRSTLPRCGRRSRTLRQVP